MANSLLKIKVVPNSSRNQISGWLGDSLKIKLQAPPEDGKANKALIRLLSTTLKIGEKQISLEFGERSPEKLIRFEGIGQEELKILLEEKINNLNWG